MQAAKHSLHQLRRHIGPKCRESPPPKRKYANPVANYHIYYHQIFKALGKTGSLGSCFVCTDIGSSKRLAMQNLQIPNTAETRIIPKWLFPPRFSDKDRLTSGCCTGCSHLRKNKKATE